MRDDRDSRNKDQEKTLLLLGSRLQLQVQDVFYLFLPIFSNKMKNELQPTTHLSNVKSSKQNHSLRQFWGASIPLSVRRKHKHPIPHPLVYLSGLEAG